MLQLKNRILVYTVLKRTATNRLLIILHAITLPLFARGQAHSEWVDQDVLTAVYTNDWQAAHAMMDSLNPRHTDRWQHDFPALLLVWWEVLLETSDQEDVSKFNALTASLSKDVSSEASSLEKLFKQTLLHAYHARFALIQGHYINGVGELNKCIDLIETGFEHEEEHEAFLLTSGLYHYFVAYAYDEYPLLRPYLFFLPDGDRAKGLAYLKRCAESSDLYLQTEARYFLMRIYIDLEAEHHLAKYYCDQLLKRFPSNLLFQEYDLKLAYATQDLVAAKRIRSSYWDTVDGNSYWSQEERERLQQRINNINP